ncbi:MAG: hypothetical protein H7A33_08395 [Deltaproteobacteria bacterium]|nr:hypothetical protein [Deltaproteobacteria bacterium]
MQRLSGTLVFLYQSSRETYTKSAQLPALATNWALSAFVTSSSSSSNAEAFGLSEDEINIQTHLAECLLTLL